MFGAWRAGFHGNGSVGALVQCAAYVKALARGPYGVERLK
jgi:hypothetical protein